MKYLNLYKYIYYKMLNYTVGNPGNFHGCNLKIIDSGAFRCNKAYITLFSPNNQQFTILEEGPKPGFNFSKLIPSDFCQGGIEIGYDISWGLDWPLRERFIHGVPFKGKQISLNSLTIKITGTTFHPNFNIRDGSNNIFNIP